MENEISVNAAEARKPNGKSGGGKGKGKKGNGGGGASSSSVVRDRNGKAIECFGCGGNHFAANCRHRCTHQINAILAEMKNSPQASSLPSPSSSSPPAPPSVNVSTFNFDRPSTSSSNGTWFGTLDLPSVHLVPAVHATSADQVYFIADSGATHHIGPHRFYFHDYIPFANPLNVRVANNHFIPALGWGNIRLVSSLPDDSQPEVVLKDALYVPGVARCLMSTSQLACDGIRVVFNGSPACRIKSGGQLLAAGDVVDGLY